MLRPSGFPFYNSVELIYFAVSPCIRVHARKAEGNTSVLSSKDREEASLEGEKMDEERKWAPKIESERDETRLEPEKRTVHYMVP